MLQDAGKDAGKDDESDSEAEAQGPPEPRWKEARREKRKQSRQEVMSGFSPSVFMLTRIVCISLFQKNACCACVLASMLAAFCLVQTISVLYSARRFPGSVFS